MDITEGKKVLTLINRDEDLLDKIAKETFDKIDEDKNGVIDKNELMNYLRDILDIPDGKKENETMFDLIFEEFKHVDNVISAQSFRAFLKELFKEHLQLLLTNA